MSRAANWLILWLAVTCLANSGCVRRRMTVRSSPPGATVYVDDQQIGVTPVSTSFVYYGTRKIQLVKDGFETLTVKHKFSTPWYQIPPIDFISENVVPYELRDERIIDLELEPQRLVSVPELVERAQQLRDSSRIGAQAGSPYPPGQYSPGNPLPPADGYREGYPADAYPPNGYVPSGRAADRYGETWGVPPSDVEQDVRTVNPSAGDANLPPAFYPNDFDR